jgi:predicted phosphodiesterase
MRAAAIYDLHGNLPALEAVLEEIRALNVDRIVVGGDVLPGPMPRECLEILLSLGTPVDFLYGNGEAAVLEDLAGRVPAKVPERYRPAIAWTARQLSPDQREAVAAWPMTVRLEIPGLGEVVFCHATPRNADEIFTRDAPEERLAPVMAIARAPVVVCGHTHMQFDRMAGGIRVINAGSAGMPFGPPGADWLLLGPGVELRRTGYDLERAAARVRATGYPDAGEIAERYILNPPSQAEMLQLYAKAELRP